ncbi:polysaccharide biosynthesis/export family protein [Roseibium sp. MMSF_3544]|uniref:polysaccharide biosynthesis/export family protein n=1 Tax=unclassified Roseibium TaxID=2629323 RepID=UPI00273D72B2|nr:polysaccharide biosynthesis/export family protein [Roseibium sp. MMSF_3544]
MGYLISIMIVASGLAACSFIPASGPTSAEIEAQSGNLPSGLNFELVPLDAHVVSALRAYKPSGFGKYFPGKRWAPSHIIGIGDTISVVVWEPGEEGLFSRAENGGRAELGPFVVNQSGTITVPYVGKVHAAGKSVERLQDAIQIALGGKAVDPQVVVTLMENASSLVTVSGAVNKPGQYPLAIRGERLLDVVAKAGGNAHDASETYVTFIRSGKQGRQLLKTVFDYQGENIYVRPGDQIYLAHTPQTFTAFGAVPKVGEYPLQAGEVSLIEALGRVGGLEDGRANSVGMYVFRYESPELVRSMKPETKIASTGAVPVIYQVNMRQAESYFYAQSFMLRDKDIIYVANAYGAELNKFTRILINVLAVGRSSTSVVTF